MASFVRHSSHWVLQQASQIIHCQTGLLEDAGEGFRLQNLTRMQRHRDQTGLRRVRPSRATPPCWWRLSELRLPYLSSLQDSKPPLERQIGNCHRSKDLLGWLERRCGVEAKVDHARRRSQSAFEEQVAVIAIERQNDAVFADGPLEHGPIVGTGSLFGNGANICPRLRSMRTDASGRFSFARNRSTRRNRAQHIELPHRGTRLRRRTQPVDHRT